jgi:hypothetical protein
VANDNTARANTRSDIDRLSKRLALLSGELMMVSSNISTFGSDERRMRAMESVRSASVRINDASSNLAAASQEIRAMGVR